MLREKQTGDSSPGNQTQQGGISFSVRNSVRETAQNHRFSSSLSFGTTGTEEWLRIVVPWFEISFFPSSAAIS